MSFDFDEMVEQYGAEYLREKSPDDEVIRMEELDEIYSELSPTEVLRRAFFGGRYGFENDSFNPNDEYVFWNGYGNLVSVNEYDYVRCLKDKIYDEEDFKQWCIEYNYYDPVWDEDESEDSYNGDDYSEGLGGPDED